MTGLCKEDLKERAWEAIEDGMRRAGYRTNEQIKEDAEECLLPNLVEDLPPNGLTIFLEPGQRWLRDFDELQMTFLESDKANVKYLGLHWCSHSRALTIFDCRNYKGGLYAFSEFAKRIE